MRTITKHYSDPLDLVWIHAARQMGMHVVRDPEVFASWDGAGTLRIGAAETLDADDSLAQMVFHEICHALVEGPDAFDQEDWGLHPDVEVGAVHEHACLRLQSALSDRHGLREFFAATTDFRTYFDKIGENPLSGTSDPAIVLAQTAFERATTGPWSDALENALRQTRLIAEVVAELAPQDSIWPGDRRPGGVAVEK